MGIINHTRAAAALLLGLGSLTSLALAEVHSGEAVPVGQGTARVVVATSADGSPTSVSVLLTGPALEGLPTAGPGHGVTEYILPMPATAPATGYDHVGLDWNPAGHLPEGIYSLPHFDVHFYLVNRDERATIRFGEGSTAGASIPPELLPAGYIVPPEGAVDGMGLHGIDTRSPEFGGSPFTRTFLYGYASGRLIFVEPMVTLAHLKSRVDTTTPVARPTAYSLPAYYPTRYRIGYDADTDQHQVALTGLVRGEPTAP